MDSLLRNQGMITRGGLVLSKVEGLLLCTCAEPCPDESQDLFSIKTKKLKSKINISKVASFGILSAQHATGNFLIKQTY
ncbi:MAG: hypothetical protein WBD99_05870 [Thermodesulfobacteriota bacterium]